jgi:hypothetical protein
LATLGHDPGASRTAFDRTDRRTWKEHEMSQDPKDAREAGENVLDMMMQPMKQASAALKEAKERATEQNEAISVRLIDFAESNLTDTLEALRAAARAKDVTEVLTIQGEFLRNQMSRSLDQFREMTELVKPNMPKG